MNNKYITITDGEDYRTIAATMTKLGYRMNHATARNIILTGMRKFIQNISEELGHSVDSHQAAQVVKRQDVHEVIGDILYLCVKENNASENIG